MKNFDYQTPTRLIFGRDVVAGLPEVMRPFGRRILLTYGGGSIKRIGSHPVDIRWRKHQAYRFVRPRERTVERL